MNAVKFLAAICLLIFAGAPASGGLLAQQPDENPTAAGQATTVETETEKTPNKYARRSDDRYRIGFQDTLDIKVYRHPELSQTVSVNPDGTINLYRIDNPVVAVCKTEKELSDLIAQLYQNFLRRPFVNVRAVEQRSQPFAVIGAVEKPGSFYLNKKVRLIQLLSLAGGYDVEKAGSKIQIARIGNLAGCDETETDSDGPDVEFLSYNLFDVLQGKQNPWVQPGDIVSVLEAEEAYVVGNVVNEAEKISLKEPVTLTQAIAMAGGVSRNAKTSKVRIQRQQPGTPLRTELVFDLKEIIANKTPDPVLQPNDIVEVPTDKMKSARNKFIDVITGGLGNIFYRFPL